ncbi:hypothetical protein ACJZ2D_007348 [Fusarium nematophilum]
MRHGRQKAFENAEAAVPAPVVWSEIPNLLGAVDRSLVCGCVLAGQELGNLEHPSRRLPSNSNGRRSRIGDSSDLPSNVSQQHMEGRLGDFPPHASDAQASLQPSRLTRAAGQVGGEPHA